MESPLKKIRHYSLNPGGGIMKTIRQGTVGKAILRLVQTSTGYSGVVLVDDKREIIDGDDPDDVWRQLHAVVARLNPHFFGYNGARIRFLHFFPEGFADARYISDERDYKWNAKTILDKAAPLGEALSGKGFGEGALSAYRATTLLSRFEKARFEPLLKGPEADDFIQAAAAFTQGDGRHALGTMAAILKRHDSAKWTVVTYLPFLWKPAEHIFLKPEMIRAFAERVGHPFAYIYKPELDIAVYDSLLDLAKTTKEKVVDLSPRDMIDIQGFMWTAVKYKEEVPADSQ